MFSFDIYVCGGKKARRGDQEKRRASAEQMSLRQIPEQSFIIDCVGLQAIDKL